LRKTKSDARGYYTKKGRKEDGIALSSSKERGIIKKKKKRTTTGGGEDCGLGGPDVLKESRNSNRRWRLKEGRRGRKERLSRD